MATRVTEISSNHDVYNSIITQVCEQVDTGMMIYYNNDTLKHKTDDTKNDNTSTNYINNDDDRHLASNPSSKFNHTSPFFGLRTLVVFRVTTDNAEVEDSAERISDLVFGMHGDTENLASRYAACSFQQLLIQPGQGPHFINGVADIHRLGTGSRAGTQFGFEPFQLGTQRIRGWDRIHGCWILHEKRTHHVRHTRATVMLFLGIATNSTHLTLIHFQVF